MTLYEKIIQAPKTILWSDILSESYKKHEKKDMEYAFLAGTTLDSANNQNMIQKWQKPWLFYRLLIGGIILGALMYALQAILTSIGINEAAYGQFIAYIIPMIGPIVLMILFWELNVPRNLSFMDIVISFLIGAAFCFFVTFVLAFFIPSPIVSFERIPSLTVSLPSIAPLREEPAKLVASVLILMMFTRQGKKQLYGFTGLTIGAAVGAAFSAYESVSYGMQYGTDTVLLRSILSVGGHVLFCAPYVAALALAADNGQITLNSFKDKTFLKLFGFSILMHALWNIGQGEYLWYLSVFNHQAFREFEYALLTGTSCAAVETFNLIGNLSIPKMIVIIVMLWGEALFVIRQCFAQIGSQIPVSSPIAGKSAYLILGTSGFFSGKQFSIKSSDVVIGSDNAAKLCYPFGTENISAQHAKLALRNGYLYLGDLGSVAGTYLNGKKLNPHQGQLLHTGDVFWIGSQREAFKVV